MLERVLDWMEAHGDEAAVIAALLGLLFVFIGLFTGAFDK